MIVTRIGDIAFGTCFWPLIGPQPAVGIVISGDPMELNSGMPTSGIGDMVVFPCCMGIIVVGTPQDLVSGKPTSTLGSTVIGPIVQAMIATGDPMDLSM